MSLASEFRLRKALAGVDGFDLVLIEHPTVHRQYYLGSATGDYICSACSEPFSHQEWQEMREGPKNH